MTNSMASKFSSKIKYLYKTSLQIIKEFGIKYYFNFGIAQLKKQKFNLFSMKEDLYEEFENIPLLNKKEQYNLQKEQKKKKLENSTVTNDFQIYQKSQLY